MCQSSVVRANNDGIKLGLASLLLPTYTMWPTFTVYRMAPLLDYISTVHSAYRCLRNSRLIDITPYPSHPSHPSCFRPAGPRKEPGKNLTTARRHITMSDCSDDDEGHRRRKSSKGNHSAIQTLGYLSEISTGAELMMSSTAFQMANVWVGRKNWSGSKACCPRARHLHGYPFLLTQSHAVASGERLQQPRNRLK